MTFVSRPLGRIALGFVGASMAATGALAEAGAFFDPKDRIHPVWAANGMVSAQERLAAEIGRDIMAKGGNAVDAGLPWHSRWR